MKIILRKLRFEFENEGVILSLSISDATQKKTLFRKVEPKFLITQLIFDNILLSD